MDFLESSEILIPLLTGMSFVALENDLNELTQFEVRSCLSRELQPIYTQTGLSDFLKTASESFVYDVTEALDTRLAVVRAGGRWILLGPYVEDGWNDHAARKLLTKLGASESYIELYRLYRCNLPIIQHEYAVRTALVLAQQLDGESRIVRAVRLEPEKKCGRPVFSEVYTEAAVVDWRYQMEERFISAISRGEANEACEALKEVRRASTDIRFLSNNLHDMLAGMAIIRTQIRMGAKRAGLSPVMIDSISQEYAQRMQHAVSMKEQRSLLFSMVERICAEVRATEQAGYSLCVRRAMDYMTVNSSKPMTTQDVAVAVREEPQAFIRQFRRETGMTIKQYIAKRRCAIAAELLLDSDSSVQEIAAYVGYTDNNYFCKVFKANQGITPQDYRRSGRETLDSHLGVGNK